MPFSAVNGLLLFGPLPRSPAMLSPPQQAGSIRVPPTDRWLSGNVRRASRLTMVSAEHGSVVTSDNVIQLNMEKGFVFKTLLNICNVYRYYTDLYGMQFCKMRGKKNLLLKCFSRLWNSNGTDTLHNCFC